jgi:catechol 2,3-dioxygenase-like lactoylglutathione lyase family enzyme
MITSMHAIIYSRDAAADRAFFRDVLGFPSVDAGDGWLIFAMPPSELAFRPADSDGKHELYLMCDDVKAGVDRWARRVSSAAQLSTKGGPPHLGAFAGRR